MGRATAEMVQGIMDDPPAVLTPFLALAALVAEEDLADSGLSEARLTQIETWLAAHFSCIKSPLSESEGAKGLSVAYQRGQAGQGLRSTQYGQTAIELDSSGTLKALADGTGASSVEIGAVLETWQQ